MPRRRVLYVSHNHPSVFPGGAEAYALELYEAMRDDSCFDAVMLAKAGPPVSNGGCPHPGTLLSPVNGDPNQYFFYTDASAFDSFLGTSPDADVYMQYFREFLLAIRPDVVHFQHTLFLGYEILLETRRTLPGVPIIYTLHEYLPICRRDGQMLRVNDNKPCLDSSPRSCHQCFPDVSAQEFFLRKRFIQSHLSLVDMFIAPSEFLLERYVDWGIPREKIRCEEYGRSINGQASAAVDRDDDATRPRTRFGFFGQLNPFKGIAVLLEAMARIGDTPTAKSRNGGAPHLWVHGANLELQAGAFQAEVRRLAEHAQANVTLVGRYEHDELPGLMANVDWVVVPSIWWENSPLVIQEAFRYGRPVISSDIGGMAEKVLHGVSGLNFRAGDADSLAETIATAAGTSGLWSRLRDGIPEVYSMKEHVPSLTALYTQLIKQQSRRGPQLPTTELQEVDQHG